MQYLRDNAGILEASANGTTWEAVVLGTGGGGVTDHTLLTNIGTNTHAQLDTHVANTALHAGTTDHTALSNIGTNTHAQIDSHIADTGIHGGGFSGAFAIVLVEANKTMILSELDASLLASDGAASRFVSLPAEGIAQGQTAHFFVQGTSMLSISDGAGGYLNDLDLGTNCQAIYSTTNGSSLTLIYIGSVWKTLRKLGTWAAQYPE